MSDRKRNLVLLVLCVFIAFSALACGPGGDLVQDMQDTNSALQDANDDLHDSGWLK